MDSPDPTGASRHRYLIEHIQDAVAEFELRDGVPVVLEVNRAFVDTFGCDRAAARGESLNDLIVPDWCLDAARALDERTAAGEVNYRRVKRETAAACASSSTAVSRSRIPTRGSTGSRCTRT